MTDPRKRAPAGSTPILEQVAEEAAALGIARVHVIAFRDRDHPDAGGSEEHAFQVASQLQRVGLAISHHTGAVPGAPAQLDRDGVRVMRRGGRLGVFLTTVLDELSGRMGPRDGLVEIFHGVPFFAPLWSRGPRIAFIHHVHLDTWHHLIRAPLDRVGHLLEERAVPMVYRRSLVVTAADSAKEEIAGRLRIPPENIHLAHHGVDPRFTPGATRSRRPLVLAVARMMPQKGLAQLLPVLADVHKRVPELEAVIVGDGPQRPELERLRSSLDADGWLRFAGRVDDSELVEWYRRAWVVASASEREGFGLTLTEAAACATPVVATRIPGHLDAVADGCSGYLASSEQEMSDRIALLLCDQQLRQRLSATALEWAGRFTWEQSAAAILAALCEDARRRAPRRR